jgi:rhodanese-related sulfurtransferase
VPQGELLERTGFTDIVNLAGGFDAWCEAGLQPSVNETVVRQPK